MNEIKDHITDISDDNDDEVFFDKKSEAEVDEADAQDNKLLEALKKNIAKPNESDNPLENWYEFKDNDGVSKVLERKLIEKAKEKELLEQENKKKVRRIMKNPIEYINLLKVYLLCSLHNLVKLTSRMCSIQLEAFLISKFSLEELELLDELKRSYATHEQSIDTIIKELFKIFSKHFIYKKFNTFHLLHNLAYNNNYTHEQIIWLFIALCNHLQIPVRHLSIIDLTSFNLDRKYRFNMKLIEEEGNKKNIKKRKIEQAKENAKLTKNIKNKKTDNTYLDKCIKSLIEGPINPPKLISFDKESSKSDDILENASDKEEQDKEIDDLFMSFQYKKPSNMKKSIDDSAISSSLKKRVPCNLDDSTDIININTYNFNNSLPRLSESPNKPLPRIYNDDYESSEYKYWLEIYDTELNQWIVINPIQQEIYKEVNPRYVQEKTHNIPALFIIASMKLTGQKYQQEKVTEQEDEQQRLTGQKEKKYIYRNLEIFLMDTTFRYCEKWTKVLIFRRQLTLKYWWDSLWVLLNPLNILILEEPYKSIFQKEKELYINLTKQDIPMNYNEFRNSEFYILPSHLRKYQGFKPLTRPIEDMYFKDEPVYLRSDVVDLHTKSRWKMNGRKVRMGQIGVKKVLALTNDGEQMVDLYGEWQTDALVNALNEDGSLPKNEYGNYELFSGDPPKGTIHIDLPYVARLCKKYEISYVDTVVGWYG